MVITSKRAGVYLKLLMICFFIITFLGGCTAHEATESVPENDQTEVKVVMGTGSEPVAGFDPFVNWGTGEHVHEPLIQSTLVTTDTDMSIINDLATSYTAREDGLQWIFTIRDDVKFTDGMSLTARDVAFTINGIKNSEASETDLSMVIDAVAIDDTTVEINLNKPYNALLYALAVIGIVPEHAYDENYGTNPIGSGRYILEQWDQGQQVILTANPDYYGEAPRIKRVVVAFMDEDAALAAAQSGQVDIAYTSAIYSDQHIEGYTLLECNSVDSRGISLPTTASGSTMSDGQTEYAVGNDVTSDLAIRQAINYAVDRAAMVDSVLNGYGTVAYSVCDGMPWASSDMKIVLDREKAVTVLEAAGWTLNSEGIYEKEGLRASIDVWYSAGDSVRQGLAHEFANQMKEIGIEVTPRGGSWDELYPVSYVSPVLWGWGSNSPSELYSLYYSTGGANFAGYKSNAIDAYIDAALATTTIEDSYELWQYAQWDGTEGVAPQGAATWVWLASVDHLYFQDEKLVVAEQKLHPHGHGWSLVNNVDQWYWKS